MLLGDRIVLKKLKNFDSVKEYMDEIDYDLAYKEYKKLKRNEFYEYNFNEEYKIYVPVETLLKLIEEENYLLKVCNSIEEFIDESDCLIFEEYILEDI